MAGKVLFLHLGAPVECSPYSNSLTYTLIWVVFCIFVSVYNKKVLKVVFHKTEQMSI